MQCGLDHASPMAIQELDILLIHFPILHKLAYDGLIFEAALLLLSFYLHREEDSKMNEDDEAFYYDCSL
eukprot:scaffold126582_cov20-Prasinocladus_malaysianus.AAC.2